MLILSLIIYCFFILILKNSLSPFGKFKLICLLMLPDKSTAQNVFFRVSVPSVSAFTIIFPLPTGRTASCALP